MSMKFCSYTHRVRWANPYSYPPVGWPLVLAEWRSRDPETPQVLRDLAQAMPGYQPVAYGWYDENYSQRWPRSTWTPERRGKTRVRNLRKRIMKKWPLEAERLIAEEIASTPWYYAGHYTEREALGLDTEQETLDRGWPAVVLRQCVTRRRMSRAMHPERWEGERLVRDAAPYEPKHYTTEELEMLGQGRLPYWERQFEAKRKAQPPEPRQMMLGEALA